MKATKTKTTNPARPRVGYKIRRVELPEAPKRVARFLKAKPAATHPEIVRATKLNPNTVNGCIHVLKGLGMLETVPLPVEQAGA